VAPVLLVVDAAAVADQRSNRCSHGSGLCLEPSLTNEQTNRSTASAIGAFRGRLISGVVSRGRCNTGLQSIRRSLKSQRFSWPLIQAQSDFIEVRLRELR
jgi:hypothetical protein